jgi:hypothetical protein
MSQVKIINGGMRNGCVGTLEGSHGEWEFKIRFNDGRFSYFLASEFEIIE